MFFQHIFILYERVLWDLNNEKFFYMGNAATFPECCYLHSKNIYPVTVDTAQKIKINFRLNYINYILGLVKLNSD